MSVLGPKAPVDHMLSILPERERSVLAACSRLWDGKPRLSEADRTRIVADLKQGPEVLGYETGLWTSWRWPILSSANAGFGTHRSASGGFSGNWDGVASNPSGSFGFRPQQSAQQTIYDIRKWVTYGRQNLWRKAHVKL